MERPTTDRVRPTPGTPKADLETPALVVDCEAMEANLESMAAFAEEQGVRLRPHVKTHKSGELARKQVARSGGGVCCQTLGEAEVMARAGVGDVYLSYQVVGEQKLARATALARRLDSFATTVDSVPTIDGLSGAAADAGVTIGAVLEVDTGLGRTGCAPADAPELASRIADAPGVEFGGLLWYEAHVKSEASTRAEFERLCHESMDEAAEVVDEIEAAGVDVPEVRVGGTATTPYSGTHPVVTEINPGMYPFNDVGELELRPWDVSKADCAATVVTTVVSAPTEDRAVVDGGSKAFGVEKPQWPVPKGRDDVEYVTSSEEHGWLDTSDADGVEVGDRIEFIAPHVCTTINLHDAMVAVRDGVVEDVWPVEARGKVR